MISSRLLLTCALAALLLLLPASAQWKQMNGPYGGSIRAFSSVPNGSGGTTLIAATEQAYLFSSSDYGASWTPLNVGYRVMAIFADSTALGGVQVFASGPTNSLTSTDRGVTWTEDYSGINPGSLPVTCFASIHNGSGGATVFASTYYGGVYATSSSGPPHTWSKSNTGLPTSTVFGLAVDYTAGAAKLFAATDSGLFVSADTGRTFAPAGTGAPKAAYTFVSAVPNGSGGTDLFAGRMNNSLYRSTNDGASWTEVSDAYAVQGMTIAGSTLWIATANGASYSTDHGATWTSSLMNTYGYAILAAPNGSGGTNIWLGSSFGPYVTTNGGTTWALSKQGITAANTTGIVTVPTGRTSSVTVVSAGYDGLYRSTDDGISWSDVTPFRALWTCVATMPSGSATPYIFAGSTIGYYQSDDFGASWTLMNTGLSSHNIQKLKALPNGRGGTNLYACTNGGGLFLSTDAGSSWSPLSNGLTNPFVYDVFGEPDGLGGMLLFAVTYGSGVFKSTNSGAQWTAVNSGISYSWLNTGVLLETASGRVILASGSGYLYRSTNDGQSWTDLTSVFGGIPVKAFLVRNTDIYAATYNGLGISRDGGVTWTTYNSTTTGFMLFSSLAAEDVGKKYLYLGSLNSGIWRRPLAELRAPNTPFISSVLDVPADQGGKVAVSWLASGLDTNTSTLVKYQIWRSTPNRTPSFMASTASAPLQRALMNTTNATGETIAWEWITDAPAHRFSAYSYTCPTLYDSVSVNSGMHLFLVSAVTSNGNVFYNSDPDSGYSVDNIPPFPPQNISADIVGNGIALTWSPNADADLQQYVVYRSGNPIRDVSGMTPYATATDTVFTDATPLPGVVNYYVLRAQDIHGNLSIASLQVSLVATGVAEEGTLPTQFGLSQNYPNPFNPSTEIRYQVARIRGEGDDVTPSLSRGGQGSRQKDGGQAVVSLRVYDLLGREVAVLVDERREPGYYEVRFDGSGLTSGIYYCRMTAGTFVQTRKLVLMR